MQILSITFLQFIFIFISLLIGVPGTDKYNILKNKLILFCGIFIFQIFINSINKIKSRCHAKLQNILNDSFFVSILSIIGYSIYTDLLIMENTKKFILPYLSNKHLTSLIISGIIASFIFLIKILQIILGGKEECSNKINEYEIRY
jgi:hypothetical protein